MRATADRRRQCLLGRVRERAAELGIDPARAALADRGREVTFIEVPMGEHGMDARPGGVGEQVARRAVPDFLGGSLPALRAFPAVAGAMLVALAMLIASRLGGGAFAQAVVAVLAAPVYLRDRGVQSPYGLNPRFSPTRLFPQARRRHC